MADAASFNCETRLCEEIHKGIKYVWLDLSTNHTPVSLETAGILYCTNIPLWGHNINYLLFGNYKYNYTPILENVNDITRKLYKNE